MSEATQPTPEHDPEIDRLLRNLRAALKERGHRAAMGLPLDGRVDNCLKAIRKAHPDVADAIEAAVKAQELDRITTEVVFNFMVGRGVGNPDAFRRSTAAAAVAFAKSRNAMRRGAV